MEDTKKWWQSKTIWGALVTVLVGILNAFSIVSIDGAAQGQIVDIVVQITGIVSTVVTIIGRVGAKATITKTGA